MGAIPHQAVNSHVFQQGKTELQRLLGLFFDPTTGEEGVDPSSQDSLKASNSPPVGGHLHSFSRDWETNNCSSKVLNLITNGYALPFL